MFEFGDHLTQPCLVFGCGNPLFGDDGFGPRVIEHLCAHHQLPRHVACLDIGTTIRDMLFDILLSPKKPRQIVIVDAMDIEGGVPGQLSEIDISQIHPAKICDFSLHQFPTTNMLKEIQEGTDIEVRVLVVHPTELPPEIRPGLSPAVAAAVPEMCRRIMAIVTQTVSAEPIQEGETQ
ncbi:hydrogenase maturation protease [Desulfatitalea tepidiphila]|uniref:hydrogenase maturation protease n=1 Tax=Desulfatitalea tepidiphila TaxID=1185843 RepID=UPI0006B42A63|nr:hydrogenase maturation protease [Desulfatitalea tepidiphila]